MKNINRVMLTGNLTREPEYSQTANGTGILKFGMAVNGSRKNQQGDWEDKPNFVDCTVIGNRADKLSAMLSKGMKVAVEGRLDYQSWTDRQTGAKRSKLEVTVDELEFMSKREPSQGMYLDDCPFD